MDLAQFIREDIIDFLSQREQQGAPGAAGKGGGRDDEYGLSVQRDYSRELEQSLSLNNLDLAKKIFFDAESAFNAAPKGSSERDSLQYILEELAIKLRLYLSDEQYSRNLTDAIRELEKKGLFTDRFFQDTKRYLKKGGNEYKRNEEEAIAALRAVLEGKHEEKHLNLLKGKTIDGRKADPRFFVDETPQERERREIRDELEKQRRALHELEQRKPEIVTLSPNITIQESAVQAPTMGDHAHQLGPLASEYHENVRQARAKDEQNTSPSSSHSPSLVRASEGMEQGAAQASAQQPADAPVPQAASPSQQSSAAVTSIQSPPQQMREVIVERQAPIGAARRVEEASAEASTAMPSSQAFHADVKASIDPEAIAKMVRDQLQSELSGKEEELERLRREREDLLANQQEMVAKAREEALRALEERQRKTLKEQELAREEQQRRSIARQHKIQRTLSQMRSAESVLRDALVRGDVVAAMKTYKELRLLYHLIPASSESASFWYDKLRELYEEIVYKRHDLEMLKEQREREAERAASEIDDRLRHAINDIDASLNQERIHAAMRRYREAKTLFLHYPHSYHDRRRTLFNTLLQCYHRIRTLAAERKSTGTKVYHATREEAHDDSIAEHELNQAPSERRVGGDVHGQSA